MKITIGSDHAGVDYKQKISKQESKPQRKRCGAGKRER